MTWKLSFLISLLSAFQMAEWVFLFCLCLRPVLLHLCVFAFHFLFLKFNVWWLVWLTVNTALGFLPHHIVWAICESQIFSLLHFVFRTCFVKLILNTKACFSCFNSTQWQLYEEGTKMCTKEIRKTDLDSLCCIQKGKW